MSLSNPKKTALNAIHRQLGGRMAEFAGWEMPVQYAGPIPKQRDEGLKRILVGFEMVERGIARDQYPVWLQDHYIGTVTSGSPAPFLQKNIGLTYLPFESRSIGTEIDVIIREKPVTARVVLTPFYKRAKAA